MSESVKLRELYPLATREVVIPRSPNLFLPDEWTKTFAQGLENLARTGIFTDSVVLEVGVGTGINLLGLLSLGRHSPCRFFGTDICGDAVKASELLAKRTGLQPAVTLRQSDLLSGLAFDELQEVNHIVACIPQVPLPKDAELHAGDNFSHYYRPADEDDAEGERWDSLGLGLNAQLLAQAGERAPGATVTLNLAGRPGIGNLQKLFHAHGRQVRVTHSAVVRQHAQTSLAALAVLEKENGTCFEFFSDVEGNDQIGATEAEDRRLRGEPVYHKIYVMTSEGIGALRTSPVGSLGDSSNSSASSVGFLE